MNSWVTEGGAIYDFDTDASKQLKSPWEAGTGAVNAFKTNVDTQMANVVSAVNTNVKKAKEDLSSLYKQIEDTEKKAANVVTTTTNNNNNNNDDNNKTLKAYKVTATLKTSAKEFTMFGQSNNEAAAKQSAEDNLARSVYQYYRNKGKTEEWIESTWLKSWKKNIKFTTTPVYAKGTTGTTRDQWAITDEPQFGDELVLVPGKTGNLSFMRKGTGVVPADLTQKLLELAQIPTSDLMNKNFTAIVPDITKNEFKNEFNFDSLVHVDHCDQNTLKDLEKMVDNKINDFSKQMNYSLKKFAR